MLDMVFCLGFNKGLEKIGVKLPQVPRLFKTMPPVRNTRPVNKVIKDIQPVRTNVTSTNLKESLKPVSTQQIPTPPTVF